MSTDPIGAAIEAAVHRAVAAQFQTLTDTLEARLDAKLRDLKKPAPPKEDNGERIVSLTTAAEMLDVHRITLLRWEKKGRLPTRRTLPGGNTGYRLSELQAFIANLPTSQRKAFATAAKPSLSSDGGCHQQSCAWTRTVAGAGGD